MKEPERTVEATELTRAILSLFRLNSLLLTAGDRLVRELGLTSARWRVLGAILDSEQPQPVSWLARNMGANRQNVQRIVNELRKQDLVTLEANPHHSRSPLVVITARGREVFDQAMRLQIPWINDLSGGDSLGEIQAFHRFIESLTRRLESG